MKKTVVVLAALTLISLYTPAAFCVEAAKPFAFKPDAAQEAAAKPATGKPEVGIMKGQLAPDFMLKDLGGKQVSLSSAKNNVVCIIFWATWCHYCMVEMPRFKELHAKYAAKGLKILAINIAANDPLPRVAAFQEQKQLPYTILYDSAQEVCQLYFITGVPVSVIIDRKGIIQYRGYQLPDNADQLIAQLL
jgi:peroxiredoxin